MSFTSGSSPLARGLRPAVRQDDLVLRIIPARAGFTKTAHRTKTTSEDHPRSRGVYPPRLSRPDYRTGSSPLARGLHAQVRLVAPGAGIIPARAGFTRTPRFRRSETWDHPRSRGVYDTSLSDPEALSGSSPLARGLRPGTGLTRSERRIIPARAGFTSAVETSRIEVTDHPRSRGVYEIAQPPAGQVRGSSPLARGLPPEL